MARRSQVRVNPRSAEIQAANQAATRATQLQQNQPLTTVSNQQNLQQNLQNLQAGNLNQVGERSAQDIRALPQIQANLQQQQAGAMGQEGQLGFNPEAFATDPNAPGSFGSPVGVDRTQRQPATPDPRAALFQPTPANIAQGISPADAAQINAARAQQMASEEQIQSQRRKDVREREERDALSSAAGSAAAQNAPQSAGIGAAFANLPPEAQFLAPFLQQYQNDIQQSIQENAALTGDLLGRSDQLFGGIQEQLNDMQETNRLTTEAMQGLLEDAREQNERNIALQQESANEQLAWENVRRRRELSRQKTAAHEAMVVQIALAGGIGQSASLAAVQESDAFYEQRMDDLQREMGMRRTDLAARFSALYTENHNNYVKGTLDNMKELQASMERIGLQSIANQQARASAEQNLLSKAWERQTSMRNDLAKNNLSIASQIYDDVQNERVRKAELEFKEKKLEADRDWDLFKLQYSKDIELMKFDISRSERLDQQSLTRMDRNVQQLAGRIAGDPVVKDMKTTNLHFTTLQATFNDAENQEGKNFTDQALINSFNKLTDPNSVVRESEFARSAAGLGLMESMKANLIKNFGAKEDENGNISLGVGGTLTPSARQELFNVAKTIHEARVKSYNEEIAKYSLQLDMYNSSVPSQFKLTPEQFGLPSRSTSQDRSEFDTYLPQGYISPFSGSNPFSGGGDSSTGAEIISMGRVTQDFTTKLDPNIYPSSVINAWQGTHKGLDVAVPQGTDLPSIVSGEVIEAGNIGGWGGTVVIRDENGALHRFSHLSEIGVQKGDKINRGQFIARTGGARGTIGAGNSTGAHIDYRVKVKGSYVDPMKYSLFV